MSYRKSNFVKIVGRLGKDPSEGKSEKASFVSLSIAQNRARFNEETKSWEILDPNWFNVLCFDKVIDAAKTLKKGDEVTVFGTLKPIKQKLNSKNVSSLAIIADRLSKTEKSKENTFIKNLPDFNSNEEILFNSESGK